MTDQITKLAEAVIFRGLDQGQLQGILRISDVEQFDRDAVIFKERDPAQELYLILKGKVRITREWALGGGEALALLEDGKAFGEMALIEDDAVRSATATVAEECTLLVLKREPFQQLLHEDRDLACTVLSNMLKQVSGHLRMTNDKVMMLLSAVGLMR